MVEKTVYTLIRRLIWVCSVCSDLFVGKLKYMYNNCFSHVGRLFVFLFIIFIVIILSHFNIFRVLFIMVLSIVYYDFLVVTNIRVFMNSCKYDDYEFQ